MLGGLSRNAGLFAMGAHTGERASGSASPPPPPGPSLFPSTSAAPSRRSAPLFADIGSEDSDGETASDFTPQLQDALRHGGPVPSAGDLVQLEILKQLRKMRKSGSDSESSDSGDGIGRLSKSTGGKLKGVLKLRKQLRRHPRRFVARYTRKVQRRLGAEDPRRAWRYSDYSMRLLKRFGKMRGLWRVHWILSELLEELLAGNTQYAAAFLVQVLKCLHQVSIDQGSWATGHLLLPLEDPLAPDEFGGDPEELKLAHSYHSALQDLRKLRVGKGPAKEETDSDEPAAGGATAQANKKKKKKKGKGGQQQQQQQQEEEGL